MIRAPAAVKFQACSRSALASIRPLAERIAGKTGESSRSSSRSWGFSQACRLAPGASLSQRSWQACSLPCGRSSMRAARSVGVVIRAVGPQLVGEIGTAAAGWWLQTALLADYSGVVRIVLSGRFCASIYLAIVVGLFRHNEPIRVASAVVKDLIWRRIVAGRSRCESP